MRTPAALCAVLLALLSAACGDGGSARDGTSIGGPAGSRIYRSDRPDARLAFDPRWQQAGQRPAWAIAPERTDFGDNLSFQTELLPRPTSLDAYVATSIERSRRGVSGLVVDRRERLTLPAGLPAERTWLHGGRDGALGFVVLAAIRGQSAASVVLTAPVDRLAAAWRSVEPYARTLRIG